MALPYPGFWSIFMSSHDIMVDLRICKTQKDKENLTWSGGAGWLVCCVGIITMSFTKSKGVGGLLTVGGAITGIVSSTVQAYQCPTS